MKNYTANIKNKNGSSQNIKPRETLQLFKKNSGDQDRFSGQIRTRNNKKISK
jgi:hypothetical protein